jgi:DNA-binding NarL/FixJ family response regulator
MEPAPPIRILSVDDHDLVRKGIAAILAIEPDLELVASASCGTEVTAVIRQEFPEARIIALTSYDGDQDIYRALESGVRGYLLKEMVYSEVVKAIRLVHEGKRFIPADVAQQLTGFFPDVALTPREVEVLSLVARGLGNKEVGTAPGTFKANVQNILSKLDAKDRTHAVTIALRRGIIHLHSPGIASFLINN